MKHTNIIGNKYNRLTIISERQIITNNRKRYVVLCKCDCGNIKEIEKSKVVNGLTKSCGCFRKEYQKEWIKKISLPEGVSAFNEIYGSYKKSAKIRNIPFELTKEEFKNLIVQPCIYCNKKLTNKKRKYKNSFTYTGIDRYDNNKGYVLNNCVPCCKICNRMKTNMTIEEFEKQINLIIANKNMWKRTA